MRARAAFPFVPLAAFVLLAGSNLACGRSAEERQLEAMREEIDRVRESRDRVDRMASSGEGADPPLVVPEAYTAPAPVRPPPTVVQIGLDGPGDDPAEGADPQDTTPRPMIRVFGATRIGSGTRRGEDQIEQTAPDEGASGQSPPPRGRDGNSLDPEAKRAYDAALSLVNAKRYDQALDALAAFLVKWPDHPYADHAMYWRGECYFARGDYLRASEQFGGVIKRFSAGSKAPDALLKLGMSLDKLGNAARAKESFDRLVQQYPESEAAHHIPALRAPASTPPGPTPEEHR